MAFPETAYISEDEFLCDCKKKWNSDLFRMCKLANKWYIMYMVSVPVSTHAKLNTNEQKGSSTIKGDVLWLQCQFPLVTKLNTSEHWGLGLLKVMCYGCGTSLHS